MHRCSVKSNLGDSVSELSKLRFGGRGANEAPACPKPRRLSAGLPDFLKLHKCTKHRDSPTGTDGRSEILDMIASANKAEGIIDSGCTGCCSPLCYVGSPPSRSDNPLVHDVEFIHQMELLSLTRSKLSDRLGFTSISPS